MAAKKQGVTIHDVDRHAGVSVGTVSRVLNGYENISIGNLDKVKSSIKELGYNKSGSAAAVTKKPRKGNLGFCVPSMRGDWASNPLISEYMLGAEGVCRDEGYNVILEIAQTEEQVIPRFLIDNKVDGIIVKGDGIGDVVSYALERDIKVVGIDVFATGYDFAQVKHDNSQAGYLVAEYLYGKGHRRFAFFSDHRQHSHFIRRRQGIEFFCLTNDPESCSVAVFEQKRDQQLARFPEENFPDADSLVEQFLAVEQSRRPSVIVCCNDWMAGAVYHSLSKHGLSPGVDVSVVGFDNDQLGSALHPRLTSYAVPFSGLAAVATRVLIDAIGGSQRQMHGGTWMLSGEIVQRDSVVDLSA